MKRRKDGRENVREVTGVEEKSNKVCETGMSFSALVFKVKINTWLVNGTECKIW